MELSLDFKSAGTPKRGPERKSEVLSTDEFNQKLLSLGFGHVKAPMRKQSDAMAGLKYEWKPGHVVRSKAFFFCQWIGRAFHVIVKDHPNIFAVHSYYLQPGESFENLKLIHKASPNAIVVIHDHPISQYCTPTSECKELEYGKW